MNTTLSTIQCSKHSVTISRFLALPQDFEPNTLPWRNPLLGHFTRTEHHWPPRKRRFVVAHAQPAVAQYGFRTRRSTKSLTSGHVTVKIAVDAFNPNCRLIHQICAPPTAMKLESTGNHPIYDCRISNCLDTSQTVPIPVLRQTREFFSNVRMGQPPF